MTYSKKEFPKLMQTAGKITILTALTGMMVFVVAFLFDMGSQQLGRIANATSTASTTLTVLNTPPSFALNAREVTESSTSTPTNSGSVIQWQAIAVDSNGAPYFLLICDTNATPTATQSTTTLGTAKPVCGAGATKWGVSAATASGAQSTVSTTTIDSSTASEFAEKNIWYAWVCDDDPVNARCNTTPVQGATSTTQYSSPFHVNSRPVLTNFYNNGPVNPSGTLGFFSTSTDPDSVGGEDLIYLVVCQTNGGINATTRTCNANGLASSTSNATQHATSSYLLASIVQDQAYGAYGYIVDQHGHTATANPINQNYTVSNVAPTILGGDIDLNNGSNLIVSVPADETTGFTLDFTVRDANSCDAVGGGQDDEIVGYDVAVYRSSVGTTTCDGTAGSYDPNDCYPDGIGAASWNLVCNASSTSCTGSTDDTILYECTFPLWFIADPTDSGAVVSTYAADTWLAAVRGIDDDGAQSQLVATSQNTIELVSFTALDLITAQIPYGALEPGDDTGTLSASTTVYSVGNTGLDQLVSGESMCGTFGIGNECPVSATSTVPEFQQKFSSSSLSYVSPAALTLSSTTNKEVELDVLKTTSTSTPNSGITYFGIAVPMSITLAGSYQGLNYFIAKTAETVDWTP